VVVSVGVSRWPRVFVWRLVLPLHPLLAVQVRGGIMRLIIIRTY
jgi:hypothetical protein